MTHRRGPGVQLFMLECLQSHDPFKIHAHPLHPRFEVV
jgi:hypothetical protein